MELRDLVDPGPAGGELGRRPPGEIELVAGVPGPWFEIVSVPLDGYAQVSVWTTLPIELRLVRGQPGAGRVVVGGVYILDPGAASGWPPPRIDVPPGRILEARRNGVGNAVVTTGTWTQCGCEESP